MSAFHDLANPWISSIGVYEPGKPIEEVARELGLGGSADIFKLAANENALGPSPKALAAIAAGAADVHLYPDGNAFYLKQALSERLDVPADRLIIGNGSNDIIDMLARVYLAVGRNIVVADRAFAVYQLVAAANRADVVRVPMKELTHDLDAMLGNITDSTSIIFVANPNNPTGTMVANSDLDRFVSSVPDDVIVCLDEAYTELLEPEERPASIDYVTRQQNVIVMRTFSKAYGLAGLRVGYAVAPPECISLLNRVRQPFNVNALALAAAQAALGDEQHLEQTRRMIREGRAFVENGLRDMGVEYVPSVVNFMLIKVGDGRAVFEELQRLGVIVRPMDGYGLQEFIRITIGKRHENERLLACLARVLKKESK